MSSKPTGVTWNSLKRKQPKTKYICYIHVHYEVLKKIAKTRSHADSDFLGSLQWDTLQLSMVHTPATTALRKHREEKMQGQGTQCHTVDSSHFDLLTSLSRSYLRRKTKPKLHMETMVQRVLLIVTITLENYEVIYTTYNQKIME